MRGSSKVDVLIVTLSEAEYQGVVDYLGGLLVNWRHADGTTLRVSVLNLRPADDALDVRAQIAAEAPRVVLQCGFAEPTTIPWPRGGDTVLVRRVEYLGLSGLEYETPSVDGRELWEARDAIKAVARFGSQYEGFLEIRPESGDYASPRGEHFHRGAVDLDRGLRRLLTAAPGTPVFVVRGLVLRNSAHDPPLPVLQSRAAARAAALALECAAAYLPSEDLRLHRKATEIHRARIGEVTIVGFKNIEWLRLHGVRTGGGGAWTCYAGINGSGKSAVLQAMTLALLGPRAATELGRAWLNRMRRAVDEKTTNATIAVEFVTQDEFSPQRSSRQTLSIHITERGAEAPSERTPEGLAMESTWAARESQHLLLAYGPGRNLSPRPVGARDDDKSAPVRRVLTLFDPFAQLASADALLRDRADAPAVASMVERLLDAVLEGTPLTVHAEGATIRFRAGTASLSAIDLPDGYRATVAWLVDLCAAWHAFAPALAASGRLEDIRAVVMVDEIDLHLHPRLQRVLVPRLRTLLPGVQWFVTTHSPLVLSSFSRDEIVLLAAGDDGNVYARTPDRDVMGFTMDDVYEWLMETPPHSAALDALREQGDDESYARALAQSPEHSAEDVREAYAFRARRVAELAARSGVRDGAAVALPDHEGEEPSKA